MVQVVIIDRLTETPVSLPQPQADQLAGELRRTSPDIIARLLTRFFDRSTQLQPLVDWDYRIQIDDPDPGTLYDVIGPDILRPRDGTATRSFALGAQVAAWHAAGLPATP